MAAHRTGARRGPDREPVLLTTWHEAIAAARIPAERLYIGGRSLGGRIASMVADAAGVAGLLCYGYPFHPPGQPAKVRTAHLERLRTPTVIFQGERDPFGTREDVAGYRLSRQIRVRWMPDGDHSLVPRKSSGFTEEGHLAAVVEESLAFIATGEKPRSPRAATSTRAHARSEP
jgi:predicted alpha/beta-hydrolase family hydrolase